MGWRSRPQSRSCTTTPWSRTCTRPCERVTGSPSGSIVLAAGPAARGPCFELPLPPGGRTRPQVEVARWPSVVVGGLEQVVYDELEALQCVAEVELGRPAQST